MEDITLILIGISVLFFVLIGIKEIFRKRAEKFCVICIAVIITWVTLLVLYWYGLFNDKLLIALLMGHTSLGIFYLIEKKVKKKIKLFRLPFLLTLIFVIYSILEGLIYSGIYSLIILWIMFLLIYLFKSNKTAKIFFKKIVECCKGW